MSSPPSASAFGGVSINPFGPADNTHTGPLVARASALRRKHRPHASVGIPEPNSPGAILAARNHATCAGRETSARALAFDGSRSGSRPGPQTIPAPCARPMNSSRLARKRSVAARARSCVCAIRLLLRVHAAAGGSTNVANRIPASAASSCDPETGERLIEWGIIVPSTPASCPRSGACDTTALRVRARR